jgi:two-component system response regulator MprA
MAANAQTARLVLIAYDDAVAGELRRGGLALVQRPAVVEPQRLAVPKDPGDLFVVDAGPDVPAICRALREAGRREPVLAIVPRDAAAARVKALDAGADDCLAKPYEPRELAARCRALLRRPGRAAGARLTFGDLEYDVARQEARRGGRRIDLTKTEARLLELFLRNPRQVLPRRLIVERVWGAEAPHRSNSLDVYVGYLRRKLTCEGELPVIQTVRGVGYALASKTGD